jgi:predicted outer membrane repeat protein
MKPNLWRQSLKSVRGDVRRRVPHRRPRFRPGVEALEDRLAPANIALVVSDQDAPNPGTLRWAVGQVNSGVDDTIAFDMFQINTDVITVGSFNGTLNITKSCTIQGPGADLLSITSDVDSLGNATRAFSISGSGTTVTFSGLTLEGIRPGSGGAVSTGAAINDTSTGTLTLRNCVISGNLDTNGGAVSDSAGFVGVYGCTFANNSTYGASGYGGAISAGASATISNSTFKGNFASAFGGGVVGSGTLSVNNCQFSANVAGGGGGVSWTGSVFDTGSTFSGNVAASAGGGGIYVHGFLTDINDCVYNNNYANTSASGGGIVIQNGPGDGVSETNGTFTGNQAKAFGGGISGSGSGGLTLTDCTFSANNANSGGGGFGWTGNVTDNGSTFSDNTTPGSAGGGAAYDNGFLTDTDCTYIHNSCSNAGGAGAISIPWNGGNGVSETDGTFTGNFTPGLGGAINANSVTATGTFFTGNRSTSNNGGAIYSNNAVTANSCTFNNNQANGGNGGAIDANTFVTANGSSFTGNTASSGSGGAIVCFQGGDDVEASSFTSNSAVFAGAIANFSTSLSFKIGGNSTFSFNQASFEGGAIYNESSLGISTSTFTHNAATTSGGAIVNDFGAQLSLVQATTLANNQVNFGTGDLGGGILNFGTVTVDASTLSGNLGGQGGAIYNSGASATTTIQDGASLSRNYAYYSGGAIYNAGGGTVTITQHHDWPRSSPRLCCWKARSRLQAKVSTRWGLT